MSVERDAALARGPPSSAASVEVGPQSKSARPVVGLDDVDADRALGAPPKSHVDELRCRATARA